MASISKMATARQGHGGSAVRWHLFQKLGRLLHLQPAPTQADDPICMSALDATTLGRYGYNEREIGLMKEGSLR